MKSAKVVLDTVRMVLRARARYRFDVSENHDSIGLIRQYLRYYRPNRYSHLANNDDAAAPIDRSDVGDQSREILLFLRHQTHHIKPRVFLEVKNG